MRAAGMAGGYRKRVGGTVSEKNEELTEAHLLRAEIQAMRQSIWNIEQMAMSQQAEIEGQRGKSQKVVVTNVNIGFWAMVNLLVTAAIAAIPALIVLIIFGLILWAIVLTVIAGLAA